MQYFQDTDNALNFFAEETERRQKAYADKANKPFRFWLPKGGEASVVFLDNLLFFILEHQFEKNGSYYNFEHCLKEIEGDCPLCDAGNRPSKAMVTSIIDLTPYTKKDGTVIQATKKLLVVKQGGSERILKRQKKFGTLVGKKFTIFRSSDGKSEGAGSDIEFEKDIELEQLKQFAPENVDAEEWIKPFDYNELFKPKTPAELRQAVGQKAPVGSEDQPKKQPKSKLNDLL